MDKTDSQEGIVICGRFWQPAGVQRVVFALLELEFLSIKSVLPEQKRLKWVEGLMGKMNFDIVNLIDR